MNNFLFKLILLTILLPIAGNGELPSTPALPSKVENFGPSSTGGAKPCPIRKIEQQSEVNGVPTDVMPGQQTKVVEYEPFEEYLADLPEAAWPFRRYFLPEGNDYRDKQFQAFLVPKVMAPKEYNSIPSWAFEALHERAALPEDELKLEAFLFTHRAGFTQKLSRTSRNLSQYGDPCKPAERRNFYAMILSPKNHNPGQILVFIEGIEPVVGPYFDRISGEYRTMHMRSYKLFAQGPVILGDGTINNVSAIIDRRNLELDAKCAELGVLYTATGWKALGFTFQFAVIVAVPFGASVVELLKGNPTGAAAEAGKDLVWALPLLDKIKVISKTTKFVLKATAIGTSCGTSCAQLYLAARQYYDGEITKGDLAFQEALLVTELLFNMFG